jgi:glycosyltransferase involved in cell wall biosynthesis
VPPEVELLVVDGASTDGTVEILRRRADRLAWWVSEFDHGVYDAWNKALPHVRGEWVQFLGADDWIPDAADWTELGERLRAVTADVRVAYGAVRVVSPSGIVIAVVGEPWECAGPAFARRMSLPHQGVFHRRGLFAAAGPFDASYRIAGDYELLLRELPARPAWFLGPRPVVANMTVGGLSLHGRYILEHVRENRRAQESHGVFCNGPRYWNRWMRAALRSAGQSILGPAAAAWCADLVRVVTGRPRIWTVR